MSFLTADEFESLAGYIYRTTGIRYESKKMYYISKRVEKRMQMLGIETAAEYIRKLRFADPDKTEFQLLINILTINETYFFRDYPQLESFAESCLQSMAKRKHKKKDHWIRIWSAGCSTGEEPYTLAIILKEMLENVDWWNIEITASDIDRVALRAAKRGVYDEKSLRDMPPEYLEKYFSKVGRNSWAVSDEIKKMVGFEHLNIGDKNALRNKKGFDFIFCRNVLIYFDDVSRKQLVDQFYVSLNPGGYIFLGSSESVGRVTTAFRLKRAGGHLVYYKG